LKYDLPAGVVLFLLALPLSLGVALASGAPLISGLISGIVGGLMVSWLSGSQLSVSGPAAGLTLLVLNGIQDVGTYNGFLLAVLWAGVIQLALGYLRAGVLSAFLPSAVIKGLLAAIGIILIIKQVPHALGYGLDLMGEEVFFTGGNESPLIAFEHALSSISLGPALVTVGSLAIMVVWDAHLLHLERLTRLIPGGLMVAFWGVCYHFLSSDTIYAIADQHLVNLPEINSLAEIEQLLTFPDFSQYENPKVWTLAVHIALIASLESLLSLEAVDKLDPYRRVAPPNRELKAQGIGNIVSALLGGIPMSAVIVRSSANVDAGGRTKIACFFHGILLLLSLLFIARWLNYIPLSALASILLYTGYKLIRLRQIKSIYLQGWDQFVPYAVTLLSILFTDLLTGISVGLVVGIYFVIRGNFNYSIGMTRHENHYLLRLRKDVSFLNKALLREHLAKVQPGGQLIIDGSRAEMIDKDIIETIEDYRKAAEDIDVEVTIRNVPGVDTTV